MNNREIERAVLNLVRSYLRLPPGSRDWAIALCAATGTLDQSGRIQSAAFRLAKAAGHAAPAQMAYEFMAHFGLTPTPIGGEQPLRTAGAETPSAPAPNVVPLVRKGKPMASGGRGGPGNLAG